MKWPKKQPRSLFNVKTEQEREVPADKQPDPTPAATDKAEGPPAS